MGKIIVACFLLTHSVFGGKFETRKLIKFKLFSLIDSCEGVGAVYLQYCTASTEWRSVGGASFVTVAAPAQRTDTVFTLQSNHAASVGHAYRHIFVGTRAASVGDGNERCASSTSARDVRHAQVREDHSGSVDDGRVSKKVSK